MPEGELADDELRKRLFKLYSEAFMAGSLAVVSALDGDRKSVV